MALLTWRTSGRSVSGCLAFWVLVAMTTDAGASSGGDGLCPKGYKAISQNLDGVGKAWAQPHPLATRTKAECAAICNARSGCTAFEFAEGATAHGACGTYTGGDANVQGDEKRLEANSNWRSCVKKPKLCNSTSNSVTTMGTCLTQQQCSTAGGSSLGTCASGFGVCCKTTKNSGTLNSKVGYVENTGYPSTTTTAETTTTNIEVTDSDVCQIRLDFDSFEMDKPTILQASNCENEFLVVTSTLFTPSNLGVQPLCGINTGQHMYIGDFDLISTPTTVATLAVTSTTNPSKWSIKVTQVDCKATDAFSQNIRAPSNCRQYFTGDTGTMTSYNYGADATSYYASNQDYQYCVKRNPTDCQIKYVRSSGVPVGQTSVGSQQYPNTHGTAVSKAATCFNTAIAGAPSYANACGSGSATAGCVYNGAKSKIEDYLSIPSAIYAGGSRTYYTQDFFCGTGVGWSAGTSDAGTGVVSQAGGPFSIRFHAGSDVPENCGTGTTDRCRLGFSLDYTKASTCEDLTSAGAIPSV